ncbi:hypothetical protein [Paraconexibacter sp. AEG42_29]|uniref:hypothetical protein n=1 Tax=Paraconexibacter sp. AEG42_29 TaxID=2997339 RepID=UPI00339D97F1
MTALLFERNYERLMIMLSEEFPGFSEELCHDAVVDALEEIRARRRYGSYVSMAVGELVNRSRYRMLDRVRIEARRRQIAPTAELFEEEVADPEDEGELEKIVSRARMRELFLPLSDQERQWLILTAGQGLTRNQAAARMGVGHDRARRLMTSTHKHLLQFYVGVADGTVHERFERRLRFLLLTGSAADALRDPLVSTHLQWCERCGDGLQHPAGAAARPR